MATTYEKKKLSVMLYIYVVCVKRSHLALEHVQVDIETSKILIALQIYVTAVVLWKPVKYNEELLVTTKQDQTE